MEISLQRKFKRNGIKVEGKARTFSSYELYFEGGELLASYRTYEEEGGQTPHFERISLCKDTMKARKLVDQLIFFEDKDRTFNRKLERMSKHYIGDFSRVWWANSPQQALKEFRAAIK